MHGSSFEDCVTTARQDIYNIMCSIESHDRYHQNVNYNASSGGDIILPPDSTKHLLVSIGLAINFIDSWKNHLKKWSSLNQFVCEQMLFEKTPITVT